MQIKNKGAVAPHMLEIARNSSGIPADQLIKDIDELRTEPGRQVELLKLHGFQHVEPQKTEDIASPTFADVWVLKQNGVPNAGEDLKTVQRVEIRPNDPRFPVKLETFGWHASETIELSTKGIKNHLELDGHRVTEKGLEKKYPFMDGNVNDKILHHAAREAGIPAAKFLRSADLLSKYSGDIVAELKKRGFKRDDNRSEPGSETWMLGNGYQGPGQLVVFNTDPGNFPSRGYLSTKSKAYDQQISTTDSRSGANTFSNVIKETNGFRQLDPKDVR